MDTTWQKPFIPNTIADFYFQYSLHGTDIDFCPRFSQQDDACCQTTKMRLNLHLVYTEPLKSTDSSKQLATHLPIHTYYSNTLMARFSRKIWYLLQGHVNILTVAVMYWNDQMIWSEANCFTLKVLRSQSDGPCVWKTLIHGGHSVDQIYLSIQRHMTSEGCTCSI